jgi:diacylglycerol kinase family enzyme
MRLHLVLNRGAGALRDADPEAVAQEVAEIFRRQGHSVSVDVLPGREAMQAIAGACRHGEADAVIAGGGDGTISAAAAEAAESGMALGVLPLGTMNLFARSLGIPLRPVEAAEALATASVTKVDIGEVNGRLFIHHVTLGLHPRMIRMRERLRYASRIGKIWASVQAWLILLRRRQHRLDLRMTVDGETIERRTVALFVSNNPLGQGLLPVADDPQDGRFGVYIARSRRWRDHLQFAAEVGLGNIAANPLLESWFARQLEVALAVRIVHASVDGEVVHLETPLRFTLHQGGLSVLMPRSSQA